MRSFSLRAVYLPNRFYRLCPERDNRFWYSCHRSCRSLVKPLDRRFVRKIVRSGKPRFLPEAIRRSPERVGRFVSGDDAPHRIAVRSLSSGGSCGLLPHEWPHCTRSPPGRQIRCNQVECGEVGFTSVTVDAQVKSFALPCAACFLTSESATAFQPASP